MSVARNPDGQSADAGAPPDVSVVLITYNHERLIRQALDSVLAQEGVSIELLIGEDCSTDGTRRVVEEYARRDPERIRLFLSPRNLNTNEVMTRPIAAARGRYVALLDGDDYWTSPYKLRTQVEQLDRRPELAISFHNVTVVYEDGAASHPYYLAEPTARISRARPAAVSTLADIAPGNFLQTCGVMFRRGLFPAFPGWYDGFVVGDWPLHVLNAEHGDIGYIDETLGAYRVHGGGLWSAGMSRHARRDWVDALADAYHVIDRHLGGRFSGILMERRRALYLEAAIAQLRRGRLRDGVYHTRRYLAASPDRRAVPLRDLLRAARRGMRLRVGAIADRVVRPRSAPSAP